jgi:arylsulfatase A-like enzyme
VVGKWHLGIGEKGTPVDWNGDVKPGPLEVGFDYSFLLPSTNDRVPCVYVENHRVVDLDPNDPLYVGMNPKDVNKPGSTVYPDGRRNREAMTFYQSTHGHDHSVINGIGRIGYMAGGKSALWDDSTMSDRFVDEAKQYIAKHKSEPFFLYFASQAIHVPRAPHPRFRGRTKLGYRGDSMVEFDWCVGELMQTLEKHGLKENTIVIFSSDNGPVYDDGYDDGTTVMCSSEESDGGHDGSGLHRGGKYQIFEGGTRVPFIIRWPARIKPGVSDAMVSQIDFTASFAELVGVELKSGEASDSRSTLKAFLGEDKDGLDFLLEESFGLALRQGDWKYMTAARPQWPPKRPAVEPSLYNLKDDPGETKNVIADHPEIAERLAKKIEEIKKGAEAR